MHAYLHPKRKLDVIEADIQAAKKRLEALTREHEDHPLTLRSKVIPPLFHAVDHGILTRFACKIDLDWDEEPGMVHHYDNYSCEVVYRGKTYTLTADRQNGGEWVLDKVTGALEYDMCGDVEDLVAAPFDDWPRLWAILMDANDCNPGLALLALAYYMLRRESDTTPPRRLYESNPKGKTSMLGEIPVSPRAARVDLTASADEGGDESDKLPA
jgi:hypothetical protein